MDSSSHKSIEKGLENLLSKIPDIKLETLDDMVSDKSKSLKSTIKELLEEINLRKNLDYEFLKKIDATICKENTSLMALENQENPYQFDIEIKKLERKLENSVLDLEKEKREEYIECWRDMMNIKRYLMMAFKEYWDFARSKNLISKNEN